MLNDITHMAGSGIVMQCGSAVKGMNCILSIVLSYYIQFQGTRRSNMNEQMRAAVAEFIGTFTLTFAAALTAISFVDKGGAPIALGLVHFLVLGGIIATYGKISGGHVNPAVTAGQLVAGAIDITRAVWYWVAQFLGAIVAALVISAILGDAAGNLGQSMGSLTADNVWQAAVLEALLTFTLVSVILRASGNVPGLAIAATLGAMVLIGANFSGGSLNPARTLGPALIDGNLDYIIPYFIGIFVGGIAAPLVQNNLLGDNSEE